MRFLATIWAKLLITALAHQECGHEFLWYEVRCTTIGAFNKVIISNSLNFIISNRIIVFKYLNSSTLS